MSFVRLMQLLNVSGAGCVAEMFATWFDCDFFLYPHFFTKISRDFVD